VRVSEQQFFCCFINLDRSFDRRERMEAQLCAAGLNAARISASDGSARERPAIAYRAEWRRWIGGQLSWGEIGCAESHRRALRAFVSSGASFGVVLEDDAVLAPEFRAVVDHLIQRTSGWDLVRLEARKAGVLADTRLRLPAGRALVVPRNVTFGSTAILYSARGARIALASLDRGYMQPVDAHLGSLAGPQFAVLQVVPPVVSERLDVSLIGQRSEFPGAAARSSASRMGLQRFCSRVLRWARSAVRRSTAGMTTARVRRGSGSGAPGLVAAGRSRTM
jgi:glycosyl transferase family 25